MGVEQVALGADFAQLVQPGGVGNAVERRAAGAVDQRGVTRRTFVGVQGLQRVDQHAGNVAAGAQHAQAVAVHLLQRISRARRVRVARAGLHVAPPAVVGAAEAHQVRALGVVTRQPHGLHHGLGAAHMERHLVQAGNLAQPCNVVDHTRVIATQQGTERLGAGAAFGDALLVEVLPKHIHAIGAGEVVENVAIEVGDGDAGRLPYKASHPEVLAQIGAVLERHPVGTGELQIRQALGATGAWSELKNRVAS